MPTYIYKCCLCGYTEDFIEPLSAFGDNKPCPICKGACSSSISGGTNSSTITKIWSPMTRQISTGISGIVIGSEHPCK